MEKSCCVTISQDELESSAFLRQRHPSLREQHLQRTGGHETKQNQFFYTVGKWEKKGFRPGMEGELNPGVSWKLSKGSMQGKEQICIKNN